MATQPQQPPGWAFEVVGATEVVLLYEADAPAPFACMFKGGHGGRGEGVGDGSSTTVRRRLRNGMQCSDDIIAAPEPPPCRRKSCRTAELRLNIGAGSVVAEGLHTSLGDTAATYCIMQVPERAFVSPAACTTAPTLPTAS